MVAHGDDIRTGVQDRVALVGGHAHIAGVFAVDDNKVSACIPLELAKTLADALQTRIAHHIAHAQYLQFHHVLLLVSFFTVYNKFRQFATGH